MIITDGVAEEPSNPQEVLLPIGGSCHHQDLIGRRTLNSRFATIAHAKSTCCQSRLTSYMAQLPGLSALASITVLAIAAAAYTMPS